MKVKNMTNSRGNTVPNQIIITDDNGVYFQSYDSMIAFMPHDFDPGSPWAHHKIHLDRTYWDYSATTGKYRNQVLGDGITETRKKIASGEYILTDLNGG